MKSLFPIFCGLLLLSGCNSGKKIDNDLKKENLKGEVILVDYDNQLLLFNDNGLEIRQILVFGGLIDETVKKYQNGKLINQLNKQFESGIIKNESKINFKYDINGLLSSIENSTLTITYNYNQDQDLIEIVRNETTNGFKQSMKYYYTKHLVDSVKSISELGNVKYHTYSYYSKDGRIKSAINFVVETDNSIRNKNTTAFKYDDNGNEITIITTEYAGNQTIQKVTEEKFEYSYDPNGNWIEKKTIIGGRVDNVLKRTIVYKGEDCSSYISKYETLITQILNSHNHLNNSNYGNNNSASDQQNYGNQQNNQQSQRKCSYCNGTGRCKTCGRTFRVHYWGGRGAGWRDKNEMRPGQIICETCSGSGLIYGIAPINGDPPTKPCHVCDGSGWKNCPDCNYGGSGRNIGQCSHCNGTGISR